MSIEQTLQARSGGQCELCTSQDNLSVYEVPYSPDTTANSCVLVCSTCHDQLQHPDNMDVNHWRCLNDTMWSQEPAVQVVAYRQLSRLSSESWAQDNLDMIYMEDDVRKWAETGQDIEEVKVLDANGVTLQKGDDVTVIKDLPVKGSSQVIKQGTVIRGINLTDDPTHVQGKVNGQTLFVIAEFCRRK
ncbi:PhnA domain protein [Salinivibrio siamensis]|uniref:PhnA domain protein n=1 Tax=Salinivibrio siamensis TaxID=414286 RepID=A0ABX3K9Q1_9GAMM|nr:PhnA domain-containing protein [Salinivibrio siamensis]OOE85610.1 PhnA domain protein [Salinivibrio siamensis]